MRSEKSQYQHVEHEFGPVYDRNSRVLILGSFPSVKSREQQFYYGHPQNRFWKVLAAVCKEDIPVTISQKRTFLLHNRIALWDVIASCEIVGSSDSSIKNVKANKIDRILQETDIRLICCNGDKSYRLFQKYLSGQAADLPVCRLPSTSPANAAYSLLQLCGMWERILRPELSYDVKEKREL